MPDVGDESFARRIVDLQYVQSQHIAEKFEVLQEWEKVLQDIVAGKVTDTAKVMPLEARGRSAAQTERITHFGCTLLRWSGDAQEGEVLFLGFRQPPKLHAPAIMRTELHLMASSCRQRE